MTSQTQSIKNIQKTKQLPGDLAIWFFIYAELAVFGILFIAFLVTKYNNPDIFAQGYQNLNRTAGLINTIALITSSYFVVVASIYLKNNLHRKGAYYLAMAIASAAIYVVVKLFEYHHAFSVGLDLSTNIFYTFYFSLTFFHFAHVLLGMVILGFMLKNLLTDYYLDNSHSGFESGASYWHMVDLVWVVLFPIVYVLH